MKKGWFVVCASYAALALLACGDDSVFSSDAGPQEDASRGDATVSSDSGSPKPVVDSGADAGGPPPPRLLVSYNGGSSTEMVAFNLNTNTVDGRLDVPSYLGTTYVTPGAPFFLAQATDQVLELDRQSPWKPVSSWNVAGNDKGDGGFMDDYADPDGVVVSTGSKAYVLRYTRKQIDVIDTSQVVDGGAPTKTIDLSSLLDPNDTDGVPDMTAAVYHAGRGRLYVLLGNIDKNKFDFKFKTNALICSGLSSSVIAIDTTTDAIVSLSGTAPGGGIKLPGVNPIVGIKMLYDGTRDRLLVLNGGCNQNVDAGVAVNLQQREIDEVMLASGTADKLVDMNANIYPSAFLLLDDSNGVVGTFGGTFMWQTTSHTLGDMIPNAPDFFTTDGHGALIGTQQLFYADGGMSPVNLVRVTLDGGTTTLGSGVETIKGPAFVGGVDVWPAN